MFRRRKIFVFLNRNPFWITFITVLILLNVLAIFLESLSELKAYSHNFWQFEVFSITVFSVEYILRIYSCTVLRGFRQPLWGRLKYALTPMMIIDFFATAPFFLPFSVGGDFRAIRIFRVFRILRVIKIGRYSQSLQLIGRVLKSTREELILSVIIYAIGLVLGAILLFTLESGNSPPPFDNIFEALWYTVLEVTSVNLESYTGPITMGGKMTLSLISIFSAAMLALPIGIIGAGFHKEIQKERRRDAELQGNVAEEAPFFIEND